MKKVELTELPDRSMIDKASVRVKGSGYCTIVRVSYSARAKMVTKPAPVRTISAPVPSPPVAISDSAILIKHFVAQA